MTGKHIEPKRLFELAPMRIVVDQPEWKHIRECDACSERFIEFVRQRAEGPPDASGS